MRLGELAALLVVMSGCTVSAVDAADDPRPRNSCDADADCKSGTICRDSVCQDPNGKIESLLLELTPPTDSALPHLSLTHRQDVPTTGGDMTFTIPRPARVRGNLRVDPDTSDCEPTLPMDGARLVPLGADGSLPLSVTLLPRERLLGLPQQLYLASTTGSETSFSYEYELQVPTGAYDVYVVPPRGQTGCVVPPQLYRNQPIDEDIALNPKVVVSKYVTLEKVCDPEGAEPLVGLRNTVCLHIKWPKFGASLEGWVADIIEPLGGLSISTEFVLSNPIDQGDKTQNVEYLVPLVYSTPAGAPNADIAAVTDLVRLRPGPDAIGPTILLDRAALGLFETSSAYLDAFTQLPSAVEVEGQMARQSDGSPSSGYVTLASTEIFGVDAGIFASYQTTVQVGDGGVFRVFVPPGKYRVHAVPPMPEALESAADGLSAIVADWEIPADVKFQAGKLLELPPIPVIRGQSPFLGAQVQVQASPQLVLPFEEALGAGSCKENRSACPFRPRANSALVDNSGRFKVQVDPGTFDVSVRVPEELKFAWFVRPGVEVDGPERDLGRIQPPAPSVVTGIAQVGPLDMPTPVPLALLRAYAYLDENRLYTRDPARAASVIQVAETRTDETGFFRLLLPSSIAEPK